MDYSLSYFTEVCGQAGSIIQVTRTYFVLVQKGACIGEYIFSEISVSFPEAETQGDEVHVEELESISLQLPDNHDLLFHFSVIPYCLTWGNHNFL